MTSLVRPHPAVWRFIHGVLVCYLLFLVFLLFQDVHDARQFLKVPPPQGIGYRGTGGRTLLECNSVLRKLGRPMTQHSSRNHATRMSTQQ